MAQTIGTSNKVDVWADSGAVVEPASSKVDAGWQLGEQPAHEFMNYEQNLYGQKINHVLQHGVPRWNDETEYGVGDFVTHNDQLYRAINVNANSEPPSGNWEKVAVKSDLGTAAALDEGTDPGNLVALSDDGSGAGVFDLGVLPVATQEQTDAPEGVEALIQANRLWEAPGWKHIATETVDGTAVSAVDLPYDDEFQLYRLMLFSVLPEDDSGPKTMRFRFLDSSGSEVAGVAYNRKQAQLREDTGWTLFSDASTGDIVLSADIISQTGLGNRNSLLADFVIDRRARAISGQSRARRSGSDAGGETILIASGHCEDTNAVGSGVRMFFPGPNIAYGKFVLMGYRE